MTAVDGPPQIILAGEPDFELGGAAVRPSSREIAFDGARETVEPRVMQVLVALARRRGEVVSRDELIHRCWEGRVVGEDAINRCLAKVRRITERMQGVTLETIPRVGYRLADASRARAPAQAPPRRRVPSLAAGLGALIALLAASGVGLWHWTDRPPAPTLAVLPFTSLNPGEEMHLFGKGIAASTAAALSRAGLSLASSAPVPAGPRSNPADVGRALGADLVVSGIVRQEGNVVRAFARLDRVDGRVTIYSRVFETPVGEIHRLPDLVAAGMVDAVEARVASSGRPAPAQAGTARPPADRPTS